MTGAGTPSMVCSDDGRGVGAGSVSDPVGAGVGVVLMTGFGLATGGPTRLVLLFPSDRVPTLVFVVLFPPLTAPFWSHVQRTSIVLRSSLLHTEGFPFLSTGFSLVATTTPHRYIPSGMTRPVTPRCLSSSLMAFQNSSHSLP